MAVDISKNNFKINDWDTIIPEAKYKIENFEISGSKLFVETLENGYSALKYYSLDGNFIKNFTASHWFNYGNKHRKRRGNLFLVFRHLLCHILFIVLI